MFCIIYALCAAGCNDRARLTAQQVQLRVVDLTSGRPTSGKQLELVYDFENAGPLTNSRASWYPPVAAITDNDGQADVTVKYWRVDRTWEHEPPAWRDEVTDKPYLVTIEDGPSTETLNLVMTYGASVARRFHTVRVMEIGRVRYSGRQE
jgi:hypothetical protein